MDTPWEPRLPRGFPLTPLLFLYLERHVLKTFELFPVGRPNAEGLLFTESAARDSVFQLRDKPVHSAKSGRRVGSIMNASITATGDHSDAATFTPGHRKVPSVTSVVVTVEFSDEVTAEHLEGTELVPLWTGGVDINAEGQGVALRPLFYGAMLRPTD